MLSKDILFYHGYLSSFVETYFMVWNRLEFHSNSLHDRLGKSIQLETQMFRGDVMPNIEVLGFAFLLFAWGNKGDEGES